MGDDPPTTRRLLHEARAGDSGALNELLGRLRPRLLAWVAARMGARLRSRVEPEDVVQEILLSAHAALPAYEDRGRRQFYAWLFTIAEHCITAQSDRFSAQKRDPRRETEVHSGIAAPFTSPSLGAARRDEWAMVLEEVGELPERYREVFRLRRIEYRGNDEVAQILGVTPNHASVLYVRAVKALRDRIAKRGGSA